MKRRNQLALFFFLAASLPANSAPVAGAVAVWGAFGDDQYHASMVPAAAQSGVVAIAGGYSHTVALKDNGSVIVWGAGGNLTNVPVAAQSGVTAIAAGWDHNVALKSDGSVVVWGDGSYGPTNVPAAAQSGVKAIAAGNNYTVVLKDDGSVLASDRIGSLAVPPEAQTGVKAIVAGSSDGSTIVLKNDGAVVAWVYEDAEEGWGPIAVSTLASTLSNVVAVAASEGLFFALKNDGSVIALDMNDDLMEEIFPAQSGVTSIAGGNSHVLASKSDGSVVAVQDEFNNKPVPDGLSGVTAVAAARFYSIAIYIPASPTITAQPASQTVSAWQRATLTVKTVGYPLSYQWRKGGANVPGATNATYSVRFAQTNHAGIYTVVASNYLGSVTSAPAILTVNAATAPGTVVSWGVHSDVPTAAQSGVTAIAAGGGHTLALKNDGSVLGWGLNDEGQTTIPVAARSGVTAIAAGFRHSVALKNDGSVVAWGAGTVDQGCCVQFGQSIVPAAAMSNVKAIVAGGENTAAVKNDGSVVVWGDNHYGQTTVPGEALSGVTAIALGNGYVMALKSDGSVVVWGSGSTNVPIAARSGVAALVPGGTMVLKTDGSVMAWTDNPYGNLYGQTTVPMTAQSGVMALATGGSHSMALKNDGTIVAWGNDYAGAVTGTEVFQHRPATASPVTPDGRVLSGATAIAAASYRTVVLLGSAPLLPLLNVKVNGNQLIFSWPGTVNGFTLQSTPELDLLEWFDEPNAPALLDGKWTVTNSISGDNKFYRLHRP